MCYDPRVLILGWSKCGAECDRVDCVMHEWGGWSKCSEACDPVDYVKSGNLYSVRKTWEARSYMLKVAGNYPGHRKYEATGWLCQACDLRVREDQDHLGQCPGYADLRGNLNLSEEDQLVEFFRLVMDRRRQEGWD